MSAVVVPGVDYRQLAGKSRVLLQPRIVNVHTMAGTLAGTESLFSRPGGPYSHLGLGGDPSEGVRQWQDLQYRAASDLDGNPYSISIETEDTGPTFPKWSGSDVPPWTPWQVETLVVVLTWLCVRFGIPPVMAPDSLPGRVGPSYHRLGIDPWRLPSGLRYSSARGKVCPGDRRIAQLSSTIVPRVAALVRGGVVPTPEPDPQEFDMLVVDGPQGSALAAAGYWKNLDAPGRARLAKAKVPSVAFPDQGDVDGFRADMLYGTTADDNVA